MKLGIFTTVHVRDRAALGCLRALVDSLRQHVRREEYAHFVIVDDCSPDEPQLRAYYQHLEDAGIATVRRMGNPRLPHWSRKYKLGQGRTPGELSYGHAVGIMAGFWYLRELGCSHAWVIDGDCVVLRPGLLDQARRLFAADSAGKLAVVTDYFGGEPDWDHDQIATLSERVTVRSSDGLTRCTPKSLVRCKNAWNTYGFPVLFCAVVDLGLEERFGAMANAGWVNSKWGARLFQQGYMVGYLPFFQGGGVFHLGFGYTKPNCEIVAQTFGNALETARYGGKDAGHYHAGFLQLNRSTEEHLRWLRQQGDRPVAESVAFDPGWLVAPGRLVPSVECGERPLKETDLDAICSFDADPESTRFLSWGPHGRDKTAVFLARALGAPMQWFGYQDDLGQLRAFGELRPLSGTFGRGTAGISYNVLRPCWRQGYGLKMLNQLLEIAHNQLDYERIEVAIDVEHVASLAVLKKRHDFVSDWQLERHEKRQVKGQERTFAVYVRCFQPRPDYPPSDPVLAHRMREAHLFDELGVWR